MDIKITNNNYVFKYRACGLIINNDKLLVVRMENNNFYCLPGGHIELGESSTMGVKREILEEVNIDTKNEKLIAIIENFYVKNNKNFHELGFYYMLEAKSKINTNDYVTYEIDKGIKKRLEFKWINLNEIDHIDFRPALLKENIKNKNFTFSHFINKE